MAPTDEKESAESRARSAAPTKVLNQAEDNLSGPISRLDLRGPSSQQPPSRLTPVPVPFTSGTLMRSQPPSEAPTTAATTSATATAPSQAASNLTRRTDIEVEKLLTGFHVRPGYGEKGRKVEVLSNFFQVRALGGKGKIIQ